VRLAALGRVIRAIKNAWNSKTVEGNLRPCTDGPHGLNPVAGAQMSLTWDQVKTRFEAANPTLKADELNVDEMRVADQRGFPVRRQIIRARLRSKNGQTFVTAVFYLGMTLVLTFVFWTFAMVFPQALQ